MSLPPQRPILPGYPTVDQAEYRDAFERVQRYIAAGDTYQVNYTYRLRAPFSGDA
jgi:para-aminobenzoate synthetase / 4-amino-4-deoxychorismate lyase